MTCAEDVLKSWRLTNEDAEVGSVERCSGCSRYLTTATSLTTIKTMTHCNNTPETSATCTVSSLNKPFIKAFNDAQIVDVLERLLGDMYHEAHACGSQNFTLTAEEISYMITNRINEYRPPMQTCDTCQGSGSVPCVDEDGAQQYENGKDYGCPEPDYDCPKCSSPDCNN